MHNSNVFSFASLDFDQNNAEIGKLASKAKAGDSAAFGQIYDLYFQKIYKFVYYRVGHKEIAEDLAEEVFIKAHAKIASLAQDNQFLGWLYQIARNANLRFVLPKNL